MRPAEAVDPGRRSHRPSRQPPAAGKASPHAPSVRWPAGHGLRRPRDLGL